jgi:hypothetical protein
MDSFTLIHPPIHPKHACTLLTLTFLHPFTHGLLILPPQPFIHPFIHPWTPHFSPSIRSLTRRFLILPLKHSSIPFIHWNSFFLFHPLIHFGHLTPLLIHSFIHLWTPYLHPSFIHPSIHSSIHQFIS